MNAITYWIADHFSITPAHATTMGVPIDFPIIGAYFVSWPDYVEITLQFLGVGYAFGYWPDGKYDDAGEAGA